MEIAASLSASRIWRLTLAGTLAAFTWIILSLLLGLAPAAHAQSDDDEGNGLLGAVTSLVGTTASTVTGSVSTVTSGVTDVVETAVSAAPAPVQQPVRAVVKAVGGVVTTTTKPVANDVSGGVVGSVATPVVEIVKQVPIVGGVVNGVGLDDAVTDLADTTDRTLGDLAGTVVEMGGALETPGTTIPGLPGLPTDPTNGPSIPVGGPWLPAPDVALPDALASDAASTLAALLAAYEAGSAGGLAASQAAVAASSAPYDPRSPAGALCPPSTLSSGPGGAGSGAWALVALGPFVAHRAWVRRAGPEDEHAPPAPADSTDVAPD